MIIMHDPALCNFARPQKQCDSGGETYNTLGHTNTDSAQSHTGNKVILLAAVLLLLHNVVSPFASSSSSPVRYCSNVSATHKTHTTRTRVVNSTPEKAREKELATQKNKVLVHRPKMARSNANNLASVCVCVFMYWMNCLFAVSAMSWGIAIAERVAISLGERFKQSNHQRSAPEQHYCKPHIPRVWCFKLCWKFRLQCSDSVRTQHQTTYRDNYALTPYTYVVYVCAFERMWKMFCFTPAKTLLATGFHTNELMKTFSLALTHSIYSVRPPYAAQRFGRDKSFVRERKQSYMCILLVQHVHYGWSTMRVRSYMRYIHNFGMYGRKCVCEWVQLS